MNQYPNDIPGLMAIIGGLREELTSARMDLAAQRARAEHLADHMAAVLQTCADLRAERDALAAAPPGWTPKAVANAEPVVAFPEQALRGGNGVFMG